MISKFSLKGSASAGMLSAVIIFAGLLVYAHYYAFAPATDPIEPLSSVAETVVVSDAGASNQTNDKPSQLNSVEPLAEPTLTASIDEATTRLEKPASGLAPVPVQASDNARVSVQMPGPVLVQGSNPLNQSSDAPAPVKSLNIQPAVVSGYAAAPHYGSDSDALAWRGYHTQNGNIDMQQIHYMNSGQSGVYRQHGRALGDGEGEFNFSLRFQGRSRMDADADADSDWNADHKASGVAAQYQDYRYYPRFAYQGYRY